jgi:hypothetical protein
LPVPWIRFDEISQNNESFDTLPGEVRGGVAMLVPMAALQPFDRHSDLTHPMADESVKY